MSGDEFKTKAERGPKGSRTKRGWTLISRYLDCSYYDECLDIANHRRWKVFTCDGCSETCKADDLTIINVHSNEILGED